MFFFVVLCWNFGFGLLSCLFVMITFTLFCVFFAIYQKGNSTRSCAHITQSTKSNEKSVVKWFNRFDILSQCPFKCRSFVCLTTSQQMKRAFYMIETKPTTSNQQHQMYWWSTTVLRFVCLYVFIANALLLMITFGSGSVWHFLFVFAFYKTPRVSCSRVRLNR